MRSARVLPSAASVDFSRLEARGARFSRPPNPGERNNDPPRHVFERRRIEGEEIWCVLIDSVQSQANRLEEALLTLANQESGDSPVPIPYITVDFAGSGLEPLQKSPPLMRHTVSMTPS